MMTPGCGGGLGRLHGWHFAPIFSECLIPPTESENTIGILRLPYLARACTYQSPTLCSNYFLPFLVVGHKKTQAQSDEADRATLACIYNYIVVVGFGTLCLWIPVYMTLCNDIIITCVVLILTDSVLVIMTMYFAAVGTGARVTTATLVV